MKSKQVISTDRSNDSASTASTLGKTTPKRATKRSSGRTPKIKAQLDTTPPRHDQIAKRAYEIWIAKGRPIGLDEQNWDEAERELRHPAPSEK